MSKKLRKEILFSAVQTFGGYTVAGRQTGAWRDAAGTQYDDETERLEIVCDRSKLAAAVEWVKGVGKKLDQKTMYFEVRDYDGVQFLDIE